MNFLRRQFARLMWAAQCWHRRHSWGWCGGRWVDWMPTTCERCGWSGPVRWAVHAYHATSDDDVEPVDECPKCGGDI